MNKTSKTLLGALLALLIFFSANILARTTLRSMRFDLTDEKLYTLTEGSRRIAENIDEPIKLNLYVSEGLASEVPSFKNYAVRVRELLEEYVRRSDGKIRLEVIDPEPFSEEEDRAVADGVQGLPVSSDETLFLGLVGTNAVGDTEVLPFFDPSKERFLEYDVSRLVYSLAHPEKEVVGILSGLPIEGGPGNPMTGQRGTPPWQIVSQLERLYDTRTLDSSVEEIPEDVSVLVMIHPRDLSEAARYAVDQFVLGGGRALIFVDPVCEADPAGADPSNPMAAAQADKSSNLPDLFRAWGFEMVPGKFVGDRQNALRVQIPDGSRMRDTDFVAWIGLEEDALDEEDPTTSLLHSLRFATAGKLQPIDGATTTFEPLVRTSEESMLLDVAMVQFRPDPEAMLASFVPDYERVAVAARISGPATSAFPDGPPGGLPENGPGVEDGHDHEEGDEHADADAGAEDATGTPLEASAAAESGHLTESREPINLVVVSDCDMISDRFWIEEQRLGSLLLGYRKTADNGDFALNAVENLSGSEDLISIRAQGRFARPFTRVLAIQREAERRFLDEERELERRLSMAQERINQLQSEKSPDSSMILSPEQAAELERAQEEMLATKKKLRDVKHNLRKDIESLGTYVKWLNLLAVPALVSLAAVALGVMRIQKRGKK